MNFPAALALRLVWRTRRRLPQPLGTGSLLSFSLVLGLSCSFQRCSFSQKTVFLCAASWVALPHPSPLVLEKAGMGKRKTHPIGRVPCLSSLPVRVLSTAVPHGCPPSAVAAADLQEGRVLAAGFAGTGDGWDPGDPGATASQGHQGRCSEAPEDPRPLGKRRRAVCRGEAERLSGGCRCQVQFPNTSGRLSD